MRSVSRLFTVVAGLLLLFLLAGMSGWLTRHHWAPVVLNQALSGVEVTELRGLTVTRTTGNLSAEIEHMRLLTNTGLSLIIDRARLTQLPALLRRALNSDAHTAATSQLEIKSVSLQNPASTQTSASPSGSSSAPTGGIPEHPVPTNGDTVEPSQVLIGDILHGLRNIPLNKIVVDAFYWPQRIDGHLSVTALNAPGHKISAQLLSSQCTSCALDLEILAPDEGTASVQLLLSHHDKRVFDFLGTLERKGPTTGERGAENWRLDSQLNVLAQRLAPLMEQLQVSPTSSTEDTTDWIAIAQSLKGDIQLTLLGEVPDELRSMGDINNLSATLHAPALSLILPEELAGLPLMVNYAAGQPLALDVKSISPLMVNSVEGKFRVKLIPASDSHASTNRASAPPLLETEIALTTEQSVPAAQFDGVVNLAQFAPLTSSQKWQSILGEYSVEELSGQSSFSGSVGLPAFDTFASASTPPGLHDLSVQVITKEPVGFLLSLPEKANPVAAAGWQKLLVKATLEQPLTISAEKIPGALALRIPRLEFDSAMLQESQRVPSSKTPTMTGKLHDLQCDALPDIACTLSVDTQLSALDLADSKTALTAVKLETLAKLNKSSHNKGVDASFSNLNLVAEKVVSGPLTILTPEFFTQQTSCQIQGGGFSCNAPQLAISIAPLSLEENRIAGAVFLKDLSIESDAKAKHGLKARAQFHGEGLNVDALGQFHASVTTDGELEMKDGIISGASTLSSGPLRLTSNWQHSMDTGKGQLELKLPESTFSPGNALSHAVRGLPADIVDGHVSASARLHWPEKGLDHLALTMRDTGIQHNESFAVGINTALQLQQSDGHWITREPVRVSIDKVDTGVAVKNLNFTLALQPDGDVTLKDFAAELLEGVLTSQQLTWNLDGKERRSLVKFTGISIGALAREMESTNFAASGLLDAALPLTTDRQGVTIEDGSLQSRPPGGRLRYYGAFSQAMLGNNPQLKLIAGALEDYNYRDIQGTVNYPLSGDLLLNMKLTGRSDAIDANRDLIINLNLENNVPTMLRSLRASRDLTDVLEQQVQ
ncbi:intermembrane phospholipid transport protein YdbH family protein [Microbulbifer mangrovi]|uniref:intermembrane phospholipid transport protein YdbH family protein n=1 Tax=Microbulbifer mangrovi TaxID=927787 RepID=UPI0009905311|nr:YdbH domain-containing protein [Microbulbifer mangrovi]